MSLKSTVPDKNHALEHVTAKKLTKTYSVIVCYRPDLQQLQRLCKELIVGGSKVVLIDNTKEPYLENHMLPANCQLITLGHNSGIAHAQNIGVDAIIKAGGEVIAFFDQDSQIETKMFKLLISELNLGKSDIVSPRCLDNLNHIELPALVVNRYGIARPKYSLNSTHPYQVDIIISSGTVATKEVFQVSRNFDEDLFIDYVDTEWCLRCRKKDIPIRVVPSAIMYHRIGKNTIKIGPLTVQVHSPERCYYQIRNCFHLFRKCHIPFLFAAKEVLSIYINRMLLLFLVESPILYVKTYLHATIDGLLGVVGAKAGQAEANKKKSSSN